MRSEMFCNIYALMKNTSNINTVITDLIKHNMLFYRKAYSAIINMASISTEIRILSYLLPIMLHLWFEPISLPVSPQVSIVVDIILNNSFLLKEYVPDGQLAWF